MTRNALNRGFPIAIAVVAVGLLAPSSARSQDVKPDFQELSVKIEPFQVLNPFIQVENLKFEPKGVCWYRVEGREERPNVPARGGAVFKHNLSQERIERLNKLLKDTQWLTADGAEGRATHTHPTKITITLKREGKERTVVCNGMRPEPYAALLHELQGIAYQERRVYLHDYVPGKEGADAWLEIGRELGALRGDPSSKSPYNIDYERYLPIAQRIVHDFHKETDDELIPAIRLATYLKVKSELPFLQRLANDRSSHVRVEVAQALGRFHDGESLPVLAGMMAAAGTRPEVGFQLIKWGDDAVPRIVDLIALSTNDRVEHREITVGEDMIRAYLDHWDKIAQPIDPRVVEAVRKALASKDPANGLIRTTYHTEFLKKVDAAASKNPSR